MQKKKEKDKKEKVTVTLDRGLSAKVQKKFGKLSKIINAYLVNLLIVNK